MDAVRITVRCVKDANHAKLLQFMSNPEGMPWTLPLATEVAAVLDGSSKRMYHPPGPGSPVGRCAVQGCGGRLKCEVQKLG